MGAPRIENADLDSVLLCLVCFVTGVGVLCCASSEAGSLQVHIVSKSDGVFCVWAGELTDVGLVQ
jgi:hypothetical protein